jgi:hypothetical protein
MQMSRIVVFGAGGRAGRAITAEARQRGIDVTAVVREPDDHRDVETSGVRLAAGDITDAGSIAAVSAGHDAAVHAVTPASGPEELSKVDGRFFTKTADALLEGLSDAGVSRLLLIGHFATLRDGHGGILFDDPSIFPPELRPFAVSHMAGLERLQTADTAIDWLMLTPPARLEPDRPRTGRYRVGDETATDISDTHLSYDDLAVAIVDEIEAPRHHRTRVSVVAR